MHPPELLGISAAVGWIGVRPHGCDESQRRDQSSQETDAVAHDVLPLSGEPGPSSGDGVVPGILAHLRSARVILLDAISLCRRRSEVSRALALR